MALGRTSSAAYYWTISNDERCENLGKFISGAQHTAQRKDFDNGKMETRHRVGGPFGREFSAFVIIAKL